MEYFVFLPAQLPALCDIRVKDRPARIAAQSDVYDRHLFLQNGGSDGPVQGDVQDKPGMELCGS